MSAVTEQAGKSQIMQDLGFPIRVVDFLLCPTGSF